MSFTVSESNFVRRGRGIPTRLSTVLIWQNLVGALLLLAFLIGFVTGFCLYREWWIHEGGIMAQPVTQGGIDYPDGGFSSGGMVYAVTGDLAELAARLGSPVTHNREGNVLFLETFEHGLGGWAATGYGTGAEVITSALQFRSGGYSCKMVAGSDGAAAAKIVRRFPYPALSLYGLEVSWYPEAHSDQVDFVLSRMDGTNEHQFYVQYDNTANVVKVKDDSGNWVTVVTGLELASGRWPFQTIKVVVDLVNDEFLRLIINETETDLSGNPAYVFANADGPHVRVDLKLWGEAAYNGFSYFDDVILTQNEPEH